MIKEIVLIAIVCIVGLILGLQLQGVDVVPLITNTVGGAFTKVHDAWNSIPNTVKGIITLGIPTAFAMFFAWTKSRAMSKLNETKVLASQETGQLTGQLTEARQVISQKDQEINALSNTTDGGKLREAYLDIKDLSTQLDIRNTRIKALEKQIGELHAKITELELDKRALQIENDKISKVA